MSSYTADEIRQGYAELEQAYEQVRAENEALQETLYASTGEWDAQENGYAPIETMTSLAEQASQPSMAMRVARASEAISQAQARQEQAPLELAAAIGPAAMQMVTQAIPDWEQYAPSVTQLISDNSAWVTQSMQTGDPSDLARGVLSAYTAVKARETTAHDSRSAKLAAQTATGGSPRPGREDDEVLAWERIRSAGGGSYENLRNNG